jgi:hypothetical protein
MKLTKTKLQRNLLVGLPLSFLVICSNCGSKGPYNPYLHRKKKITVEQVENDKRFQEKQAKAYKKQMGRNRKHLFGRKKP